MVQPVHIIGGGLAGSEAAWPRLICVVAGLLFASLAAPPASAQPSVTRERLNERPREVTDGELRDQLWSVVGPRESNPYGRARITDNRVLLVSRAYPSFVSGLCRQDHVSLLLAAADAAVSAPGATTPMRAYGVETRPYFNVLPAFWEHEPGTPGHAEFRRMWDGPCSRLVYGRDFFRAPDDGTAAGAYRAWRAATRAVAAGTVPIGTCVPWPGESRDCRTIVAEFGRGPLLAVGWCEGSANTDCFDVRAGMIRMRILMSQGSLGADSDRVLRVDLHFDPGDATSLD